MIILVYFVTRSTLSSSALVASHSTAPASTKPVYVRSVAATYTAFSFFEGERGLQGANYADTLTHARERTGGEGSDAEKREERSLITAARQSVSTE